jgi:hypothetical protein
MGIMRRMRIILEMRVSAAASSGVVAKRGHVLFLLPWLRIMRRMFVNQKEGYDDRYEGEDC